VLRILNLPIRLRPLPPLMGGMISPPLRLALMIGLGGAGRGLITLHGATRFLRWRGVRIRIFSGG
jgi:hypothetical protein